MITQVQINLRNRIGDFLTPEVISVAPADSVATAVRLMETHTISCVPVLEQGKPVGIFTESNLTRYVVRHGFDFAVINDTYGHHAGDIVLKTVALRMNKAVREIDTISRMGGDEFLMILAQMEEQPDHALQVAERIAASIEEPIQIEGRPIGIAYYPSHAQEPDTLVKAADKAMYRAKEYNRANKRSNIQIYQP